MPERATVMNRSEKSAEAVLGRHVDRRAEREGVFEGRMMREAWRQMSVSAGRLEADRMKPSRSQSATKPRAPVT